MLLRSFNRQAQMNIPQFPLPQLGRMMVFIDGENLVCRYQDMVAKGRTPNDNIQHEQDVFVWASRSVEPRLHIVSRATYYTYSFGAEPEVNEHADRLSALDFENYAPPGGAHTSLLLMRRLSPQVFRKERKQRAGKGVDIKLTVDALTHVYQDNLDAVYLISGDGDYKPLVVEAQRLGKLVFIAALSSGLNPEMKRIADVFIDLDPVYFKPPPDVQIRPT